MNSPARRIALYGGAFDPPHNGHLAAIALLLNSGVCDEVVVVPSGERPDKRYGAPTEHRIAMTRIALNEAFGHSSKVTFSDVHALGTIGHGTIDLVEHFGRRHPTASLAVVIGTELVKDLPTWKDAERLRELASFLVINRPGAEETSPPAGWSCQRVVPPYDGNVFVSSTTLRAMLAQGALCAGLMPPRVISYCAENGLYRPS